MKNSKDILFSIVIPTYNHGHLIARCLNSLLAQTYTNWEAIVVNNFSEDNTKQVVEGYKDERIKLIDFANKGVIGASRNRGIKEASGEWICFLDSDDWWKAEKLERCLPHLDSSDFIYHGLTIERINYKKGQRKTVNTRKLSNNLIGDLLINGNAIPNSSVAVRGKVLESVGFITEDPQFIAIEDIDYWIRIAQYTSKFTYIPDCLGYYWIGLNSNISGSLKQIDREKILLQNYQEYLSANEKKKATFLLDYKCARIYHQNGEFELAIKKYYALMNKKYAVKSFIGIILCVFKYRF